MEFENSLSKGKIAEQFAEQYFTVQGLSYIDVRDDDEYRKIDVDYLVGALGKIEVKLNFTDALKYRQGKFFWIEVEIEDKGEIKDGWWGFSQTDYFLFFDDKRNGILIQNDKAFKKYINHLINFGDREKNRFDYKKDERYNRYITAKNMRVYIEDLVNLNIEYKLLSRKVKKENENG